MSAKTIYNSLCKKFTNKYAIMGVMANMKAESACKANNLQDSYNKSLGMTDAEYTKAVDDGSYTNFVHDSAGYGLCQWTYYSRKQLMYDFIVTGKGVSIANENAQVEFFYNELSTNYKSLLTRLNNATSVAEATEMLLLNYERPACTDDPTSEAYKKELAKRVSYGEAYYKEYVGEDEVTTETTTETTTSTVTEVRASEYAMSGPDSSLAGTYKVTSFNGLNIRDGAGTTKTKLIAIPFGTNVRNYGYYTTVDGVKWLYVQFTYNGIKYTGFGCSTYLKKV